MSLGIIIKGTEGIVLAVESRLTLSTQQQDGTKLPFHYDNATKLFSFNEPHHYFGVAVYGQGVIGNRSVQSFTPEIENNLPKSRRHLSEYADFLSSFYLEQWKHLMPPQIQSEMILYVGGYNANEPYGKAYQMQIPSNPSPVELNPDTFGMTWGGQVEYVQRIVHGFDHRIMQILVDEFKLDEDSKNNLLEKLKSFKAIFPYEALPLQDLVNLAIFLIKSTIEAQRLSIGGLRGCGGSIDVAIVTRQKGLQYIQRKEIAGINI